MRVVTYTITPCIFNSVWLTQDGKSISQVWSKQSHHCSSYLLFSAAIIIQVNGIEEEMAKVIEEGLSMITSSRFYSVSHFNSYRDTWCFFFFVNNVEFINSWHGDES